MLAIPLIDDPRSCLQRPNPERGIGEESAMISVEEQTRIAVDYIHGLGSSIVDLARIADDMTAWSFAMRMVTREEFLPRLRIMSKVFPSVLKMTIDSTAAQPGRWRAHPVRGQTAATGGAVPPFHGH
jgi:hypothetical protein